MKKVKNSLSIRAKAAPLKKSWFRRELESGHKIYNLVRGYLEIARQHSPVVSHWSRYINTSIQYNSQISFISKTKQRG